MTEYTINHEHKMILFWGGMYSNWHPAKFRIDGKTYSTVEKYMMAQKAITMGDMVSHAKIMKCNDARLIKSMVEKLNHMMNINGLQFVSILLPKEFMKSLSKIKNC